MIPSENVSKTLEFCKRRLKHCKDRLVYYENNESLSIHGHHSMGYWLGKMAVYEDMIDILAEVLINK